jgi:cytochrome b561
MTVRYTDAPDRWRSRTARFDPVIRFLHWLTLFSLDTIFVPAFSIDFASSKDEAVALVQLHRSLGVTVWV